MDMDDLTKQETNAIAALRMLAGRWPRTMWLFSASGTLYVMRCGENGEHVMTRGGGVDPDYIVTHIMDIDNDGGDW